MVWPLADLHASPAAVDFVLFFFIWSAVWVCSFRVFTTIVKLDWASRFLFLFLGPTNGVRALRFARRFAYSTLCHFCGVPVVAATALGAVIPTTLRQHRVQPHTHTGCPLARDFYPCAW